MIKKIIPFDPADVQILKYTLAVFLSWRIIITFIAFFGLSFFPHYNHPIGLDWPSANLDFWIRWANWDGGHFKSIVESGYQNFQVVFFPLYPLLVAGLTFLSIPSLWAGLIISNLSIFIALFFLYKLVLIDYDDYTAKRAILLTLAFPTAFYFGTFYSESLFLLLAVASFYFARKKYWFASLILAGLASVTRLVGLALIAAIALEYFLNTTKPPQVKDVWLSSLGRYSILIALVIVSASILKNLLSGELLYLYLGIFHSISAIFIFLLLSLISLFFLKFILSKILYKNIFTKTTLYFFLSLLPFFLYCFYMFYTQGNFLAFINYEEQWGRHLNYPWAAPLHYFKRLLSIGIFQIGNPAHTLLEFTFFLFFLILLIFSYFKLRISYTLFFAAGLLLPILSGTLIAIHRYVLIIFPMFIILAKIKNQEVLYMWLYFSLMLQGVLLVLFFNSYWVS